MMTKLITILLGLFCLCSVFSNGTAVAEVPYPTHYYDNEMRELYIQPIYVPDGVLEYSFEEPIDLFITPNDHIFVVDKSTDKVIEFDKKRVLVRLIGDEEGDGKLSSPEGVFVTQDGLIYIADSGNRRIAVFSAEGKILHSYGKPASSVMKENFFVPVKLVVDQRGVMYIAVRGSDQGLVRINQQGEFTGFFGANKSSPTFINWIKKLILNKEQMSKEVANKPRPIANVSLDPSGFIISVTPGIGTTGNIRKLNAGGIDSLKSKAFANSWHVVSAVVDRNNFLYSVEQTSGKISIYDPKGNIIFDFGEQQQDAQQSGLLIYPTSIGVNSDFEIVVADSGMRMVQFFKRTEFAGTALTAMNLYYKGRYTESKKYWGKIAFQNEMIDLTYQGLGKVDLLEGNYNQALGNFKLAYDAKGYSEALWNVRIDRIKTYFLPVLLIVLALFISYRLLRSRIAAYWTAVRWKPWMRRYGRELQDFFYVIFHPYEGYYRLKDRKISWVTILTILLLASLAKVYEVYGTGFIFHTYDLSQVNIVIELLLLGVLLVTWVIANYLVCSVKGGEGRFREVIQASVFCLAPYIAFTAIIVPISNIVVLEESILVTATTLIMFLWMIAQFFVMTQVIHSFDFLEAIKNMLITVFAILMFWFFGLLVSGLTYNLSDFFYQLYKEVFYYV